MQDENHPLLFIYGLTDVFKCKFITSHISKSLMAELKTSIMGPKDATFLANRQLKEEEPESEFEDGQ